jgi:hypothetical protein
MAEKRNSKHRCQFELEDVKHRRELSKELCHDDREI